MKRGRAWRAAAACLVLVFLLGLLPATAAAADSVVSITPDAAFNGEALTITATGLGEQISDFDLTLLGLTGVEYFLYLDHNGTFSFDKDVTLFYQGAASAEMKAGVVNPIADDVNGVSWSEHYVQLDNGDYLMLLDSSGDFANRTPADTPIAQFPGTVTRDGVLLFPTSGACGNDLSWVLDGEGVLTVSGTGNMREFGFNSAPWYKARNSIRSVVLEDGVTSISAYAFRGFPNLASVRIPEGVTSIGYDAFYNCNALLAVSIPASVSKIGSRAFAACGLLQAIEVSENNPNYRSVDGVLFSKDGKTLCACPAARSGAYSVPEGVTTIGYGAFHGCFFLQQILFPSGVTGIEGSTFLSCYSLTELVIPEGVSSIGEAAFWYCTKLKSITIPASVTSIKPAFMSCSSLTDVYYGGSEEQWARISIDADNAPLLNAAIHYNAIPSQADPVTITRQPVSVTAESGAFAEFSLEAAGENLCYQWQYWNGSDWSNTGDDWNSSTDTMSFRTWDGGNGLLFRCVVWNALNSADWAASDTVSLTVTPAKPKNPVKITRQPVSRTAESGTFVSYSVEATGENLRYQWQYWNGEGWANTGDDWNSGTDTMSFRTWDGGNGLLFRCVVWNALNGEDWAVSNSVSLTVTPSTAVTITRQPASRVAESGTFASFSVEATGKNLCYQWQYWDGQNWQNTGDDWNSGTSTMSFRTWDGGNGLNFRCVVWNALNGEDWAVSDTVTIIVTPSTAVTITQQPVSKVAPSGAYVSYSVEAAGKNLCCQWQYWDGQNWRNTGDDWNSGTSTMIFQTWPGGNGLLFRCVVWNALNGEDWAVSDTVSLTVF